MTAPLRIALADDSVLFREGLAGLLTRRGHEVCAQLADAAQLRAWAAGLGAADVPDVLIADVRMPCLLYTSPSPRDKRQSRMPSSA